MLKSTHAWHASINKLEEISTEAQINTKFQRLSMGACASVHTVYTAPWNALQSSVNVNIQHCIALLRMCTSLLLILLLLSSV